jgi:hypothetical protein
MCPDDPGTRKKAPKIGIAMAAYAYVPADETEECLRDARHYAEIIRTNGENVSAMWK